VDANETDPVLLTSRTICGDRSGPHLLITGGVHGDEFTPMAAVRRLIGELSASELAGRVTLVPVVNEAAWRRGTRTADDGLDLARTCPGDPNGTITQRTAHALSELIRTADFYIDLHTGSFDLSLLPLSGYVLHPDEAVLDQQRNMARAFNLPIVWGTSASLEGRSLSVARDAGIPAIYAEYLGSGTCSPAGVADYVEGCRNVMGLLGMLERPQPAPRIEHFVEDPRTGSGHMQVQNPAPMTGFFEPCVSLGDRIAAGKPLGTVVDLTGEMVVDIPADREGLVLGLRTFPRVLLGESVAVILEMP
jgi:predicted deacylase